MKLENIFGMHIGCMVRWEDSEGNSAHNLQGVINGACYGTDGKAASIKKCKLLLNPLSKIEDKDTAAFEEHFLKGDRSATLVGWEWNVNLEGFLVHFGNMGGGILYDSANTMFLAASLGYDIGIVPDEYKIVKGG